MGGPPPAMTSNENYFLWPVAACWAPGASVEVFLRLGGHFGVPRCVASGPTTENVPPKTFLRTPIAKTFASRGGGVGLHEVASPRARAEMRRTAFSAELKRRPTQADTGSSTCTAHRLCSRRRQHGHDDDQGASTATTTTTTTITPPRAKTAAAASRVKASLMPTTRFNLFEKIFIC